MERENMICSSSTWGWYQLHFDSPPMTLEFGKLDPYFAADARFYVPISMVPGEANEGAVAWKQSRRNPDVRWKRMSFEETKTHLGGVPPQKGTLDVLAQASYLRYPEESAQ